MVNVRGLSCFRAASAIGKIFLLPSLFYRYVKQLRPTEESVNTLCCGYHITARKI